MVFPHTADVHKRDLIFSFSLWDQRSGNREPLGVRCRCAPQRHFLLGEEIRDIATLHHFNRSNVDLFYFIFLYFAYVQQLLKVRDEGNYCAISLQHMCQTQGLPAKSSPPCHFMWPLKKLLGVGLSKCFKTLQH